MMVGILAVHPAQDRPPCSTAAFFAAFVVAACASVPCATGQPIVTTQYGPVQGYVEPVLGVDVAQFRGIPFAAPPVGRQGRWHAPAPPAPWSAPLNTTQNAAECVQFSSSAPGSEDCLYLNVFTTKVTSGRSSPDSLVPVMFWIYGGSLVEGSPASYGTVENLVAIAGGDVVVVAASYRLNVLGYLALDELSAEDPRGTSGNYGVMDQQFALQWVQKNIAAFGGDATRVTLYGQSSGGTSIFALLSSPASKGLFQAVISLSGSPMLSLNMSGAVAQNTNGWLANTPCAASPAVLDCIYNLTALQIETMTSPDWNVPISKFFPEAPTGNDHGGPYPAVVIVDGVTLTMSLTEALASGLVDVPAYFATMRDESDGASSQGLSPQQLEDLLVANFAPWNNPELVPTIMNMYADVIAVNASNGYFDLDADTGVGCGHSALGHAASTGARKSPLYLGVNFHPPGNPNGGKAFPFHGWDYTCATQSWGSRVPTADDIAYGNMLRAHWLSLAFNGTVGPDWQPVSAAPAGSISTAILGGPCGPTCVTNIVDYKRDVCETLASFGIDSRFWWIN